MFDAVRSLPSSIRPDQVLVYFGSELCYTLLVDDNLTITNPEFQASRFKLDQMELRIHFRHFVQPLSDEAFLESGDLFTSDTVAVDALMYHRSAKGEVLVDQLFSLLPPIFPTLLASAEPVVT